MNLFIKKLNEDSKINKPAYCGDCGYDVFASQTIIINPGNRFNMPLGIALQFPETNVCLVQQKSGNSIRSGFTTIGNVIDSNYRGEIHAIIANITNEDVEIIKGDKVAQLLFLKVDTPIITYVNKLKNSDRNKKGFGSSGK